MAPYQAMFEESDVLVRAGPVAEAIQREALELGATLLIIGSGSHARLVTLLMGSTTEAILRSTRTNTLLVPPNKFDIISVIGDAALTCGPVLAAVDLAEDCRHQLEAASRLAGIAGQPLLIMTVARQLDVGPRCVSGTSQSRPRPVTGQAHVAHRASWRRRGRDLALRRRGGCRPGGDGAAREHPGASGRDRVGRSRHRSCVRAGGSGRLGTKAANLESERDHDKLSRNVRRFTRRMSAERNRRARYMDDTDSRAAARWSRRRAFLHRRKRDARNRFCSEREVLDLVVVEPVGDTQAAGCATARRSGRSPRASARSSPAAAAPAPRSGEPVTRP